MAWLVTDALNVPLSSALAGSATVSLSSLGLTVANDDYILIALQCSATLGTLSETSGGATTWDTSVKFNVTTGARMWLTWGKVSGGVISNPTFSLSAGTGLWQATVMQWRDADATTFSAGSVTTDHGNVNTGTTGTLTPSSNNAAVVYFLGNRNSSAVSTRLNPAIAINQKWQASADDGATVTLHTGIGTVQQATAAATAQTFYSNTSGRQGSIVLAIKNATGGAMLPDSRVASTKVAWLGDFGTAQEGLGTVWGAPSTFCASMSAFGGVSLDTNAPTINNALAGVYSAWTSLASAINSTLWVGGWYALPSTVDMTGKLISLEWWMQTFSSYLGANGVVLALGDDATASTGNGIMIQLAPKLLIDANTPYTSVIDPAGGTILQTFGTMNLATVKKIGLFYHRIAAGTSSRAVVMRNLFMHAASTITGGSSTRPLNGKFLNLALNGWGLVGVCNQQGDATLLKTPIQIGDGATETYFDSSATLINTPAAYSTINQPLFNAPADSILVNVKAAATDTINIAACTVSTPLEQKLEIDAASNTGATYSFAGGSFVGSKFTDNAGVAISSALFSGGATATFAENLSAVTVQRTTAGATAAAVSMSASGKTITSSAIDVTGTSAGYHLELGTSVTAITLADVTFTGTPAVNKVHVLKTSGTVTITISGTTSLSAGEVTSAGATVVIAGPTINQSVTISGAVAGSRIQIYDTTSSTELYNGTPTFPYTWTDASPAAASRAIRLRVAKQSGASAKTFIEASIGTCGTASGSEAVSYLVNQTDDAVYNTNAIDGSTVTGITITPSPARVKISIGGGSVTYPQIYAYQVYWLATATGIADEAAFIDAPDTANYLFTNFDIRNDSAVPLTITGGYGRDAVSGLVADIIDVAGSTGNIYPQPDHAIPYSSGSGLTAGQAAQLAAVTTSTANLTYSGTALQVDIVKVNGLAVSGSGTEANPWGPA